MGPEEQLEYLPQLVGELSQLFLAPGAKRINLLAMLK